MVGPTDARVVYDVHHPKPWGWKVATYLWTKSIGAGAVLLAAVLLLFGWAADRNTFDYAAPVIGMVFVAITAFLLVIDLKRPERFWFLLAKPNPRSWLVWGGWILTAFGAVAFAWLIAAIADADSAQDVLMALGIPLGIAAAGYTAFLFGQAEGRDYWQSPLLLPHLIAQSVVAGSAALLIGGAFLNAGTDDLRLLAGTLAGGLVLSTLLLASELTMPHVNRHVRKTVSLLTDGPYSAVLFGIVLLAGVVVPLLLAAGIFASDDNLELLAIGAAVTSLVGLWAYERIWVSAGQDVPLS
jgi:formate-dependent nitrite reductase membrane component NrfD